MIESPNMTQFVGKSITDLRGNRRFEEVYVFDHGSCDHRIHFFKSTDFIHSAKGVVVVRSTDVIERILPDIATTDKGKTMFRAGNCIMPIYRMLGELAFQRGWLADDDMREAMVKSYDGLVYNRDPLFYSLLVYHRAARLERQPDSKGLWPFKVITWDTDVRFRYGDRERYAHRRLSYKFADNPRLASRIKAEYRIRASRRDNNLPDLTLARNYPVNDWANTKTFMSQPENIPYLDALYAEVDRKKK